MPEWHSYPEADVNDTLVTLLMVIVVGLILGLAHGLGFIDTNADLLFKQD